MAFLEGVGKAIGKASQTINDAAQVVNNAAQETRENIAKERQQREEKRAARDFAEKEKIANKARKCPKCGNEIAGFTVKCSMCGYELKNVSTVASIKELTKEIEILEKKRNTVTDKLATVVSGRSESPTDEKVASLIRNFVVPNSKEDIFEFMILASGNMNAKVLAGRGSGEVVSELVVKTWASKFEQTYEKAKISFGADSDFEKIQKLYDKKMDEIEKAKPFSFLRRK